MLRGVALVCLAVATVGCTGGDQEAAGTVVAPPRARAAAGIEDPKPGRALIAFVRAAGRADAAAMWALLSKETRASYGPTLAGFRAGSAHEFEEGLGTVAPQARVILSRRLDDKWSVAAVAGERTVEGVQEYFAYGAALRPEGGRLKLELGGIVVSGHRPEPADEIEQSRPQLAVNLGAGGDILVALMWLDGRPVTVERGSDDRPFTATLRGRPTRALKPGQHEVVVFAATRTTAEASAWTFAVKGSS